MVKSLRTILILFFAATLLTALATTSYGQGDKTPQHFFNEAIEHEKVGETDAAILAYQGAINLDPKYVDALNNLGAIYFKKKDMENALDMFRKAVDANPADAASNANLGRVELVLKRYTEAEAALTAAAKAAPSDPDILSDLSKVYYNMKNWPALIETLNSYHGVSDGDDRSWFMLGKAYQRTDKNSDAIAAFKNSVAKESNYGAHFGLGQIYLSQNKFSNAASSFDAAYKANSKGFRAMYNYAIAVESGDPENYNGNITAWERFVKAAGKNSRATKEVAEAKNHIKELKAAKEQADLQ